MPDDGNWRMAPVLAGMCRYESYKNGDINLCDVADLNDALLVQAENRARAEQAAKGTE